VIKLSSTSLNKYKDYSPLRLGNYDMADKIDLIDSKEIYSGRVIKLLEETILLPGGKPFRREIIKHPGAVVILPQLADGRFLMVRQYRHAARQWLLEFPAGTLEPGEEALSCAQREIQEEVGYAAADWTKLGELFTAPGFCSELLRFFLARDLSPSSKDQDEDELIKVETLALSGLEDLIKQGKIHDAKTVAGVTLLRALGLVSAN
jgi:ADP-ribose pyrophosphatase